MRVITRDFDYEFWTEKDTTFQGLKIPLAEGVELRVSRVKGMQGQDQADMRIWTKRHGTPCFVARKGGFRFDYKTFMLDVIPALSGLQGQADGQVDGKD